MQSTHTPSPAASLRARARTSLQGKWILAILVTLLASILGGASGGTFSSFNIEIEIPLPSIPEGATLSEIWTALSAAWSAWINQVLSNPEAVMAIVPIVIGALVGLLSAGAVGLLIGAPVRIGLSRFRLSLLDGEEGKVSTLFSAFRTQFFKALCLRLLRGLYVFLWSLLFIIPGIIATYRYAMADYAMAENPDMSASDALRESARMMRGNKWRLFCLQWSFIGWQLLCVLTCGIGQVVLSPYIGQAEAAFYDEASGRAKVRQLVGELELI